MSTFLRKKIQVKTFSPGQKIPEGVIFPQQIHGTKICEAITGKEDLCDADGVFTSNMALILGIKTADCAPITFIEGDKFGIVHAGWRGLVKGIVEKCIENFKEPEIHIGPFLMEFEIQKDDCFYSIKRRFGDRYFMERESKILFNFYGAVSEILPNANFDKRNTFLDTNLASWRRDKSDKKNITIVGVW
ncbi:MAG: polyphenol oxidase family protein [Thermodesulfobacteriota bacterium]|nr:polyphenol oxidase family protein [Thermodesulfobacteriota bacterium]